MSEVHVSEHQYSFHVTGATLYEVEQTAVEECNRYFGDLEYRIAFIHVTPKTYRYEHGAKVQPIGPVEAEIVAGVPASSYRQWREGTPSWNEHERSKFADGVRRTTIGRSRGGRTVE